MTNPTYKPMSLPMKLIFWLVVANAFLAAFALVLFPTNTESMFFWNIMPPINAALFGMLYLVAGSLVLQAVLRGLWEPARYLTAMIPAFTGMLLLTTLLHLDRFVPGFKLYYWLAIYIIAPLAGIFFYWQHERGGANWQVVSVPVLPAIRLVAVAIGASLAVAALLAYIFPTLVTGVWPWTISPLMVRVFMSWNSAAAVMLLWFGVERDWSRLQPAAFTMVAIAVLGLLMLFVHRGDLNWASASAWGIVVGDILFGLLGAFIYGIQQRRAAVSV